ncbi:hypothetical protein [Falsiroseomonas sp. E2-1-a4]
MPEGPRTTISRAEDAHFETGLRSFFAYRDLGCGRPRAEPSVRM